MRLPTFPCTFVPRPWAFAAVLALAFPAASAWAEGAAVDVATPDQKASAQAHFEKAIKYFEKEKYDDALGEFQASYGDVASPNAHYMVARCLDKVGRSVEAYNALATIDKEAKGIEKYAQTVKQSSELRAELAKKIGILVVTVTGATTGVVSASVGGAPVPLGESWGVTPGRVEVIALLDGKAVKSEKGAVAVGETRRFTLDVAPVPVTPSGPGPQPQPPLVIPPIETGPTVVPSGPKATGFYIGAGVLGAAAVVGFAVAIPLGLEAKSNRDDFISHCDATQHCTFPEGGSSVASQQAALDDRRSKIDTQSLVATVGYVVGAFAAAGSITLAVVGATRPKVSTTQHGHEVHDSSIGVAVGPGSVTVIGSF
jgi:hypothetical protein